MTGPLYPLGSFDIRRHRLELLMWPLRGSEKQN